MNRQTCLICGRTLVPPSGPLGARLMMIGEFPGMSELQIGMPWCGKAGQVLRLELDEVGIDLGSCRSANLWMHEKVKDCDPAWHLLTLRKEMVGRFGILFMGSDVSSTIFGIEISKVNGLEVANIGIPGVKVAVLAYNPAIVLRDNGILGEFRLAVKRFARLVQEASDGN